MKKISMSNIATAMAVRPIATEGPIIRECYQIMEVVALGMKEATKYFQYRPSWRSGSETVPGFVGFLSEFPGGSKFAKKYGDITINVRESDSRSTASFDPIATAMNFSIKKGLANADTKSLLPLLTTDLGTAVHEIRHWVDYAVKGEAYDRMQSPKQPAIHGYNAYYSQEHEIDARLAELFVRLDRGYLFGAVSIMRGKHDTSMVALHIASLKNEDKFLEYARRNDVALTNKGITPELAVNERCLTVEALADSLGKIKEFYKLMYDEYGMAFRVIPKSEVTEHQLQAWKSLKQVADGTKTTIDHISGIREPVIVKKLKPIVGDAAKPAERAKSTKKLAEMVRNKNKAAETVKTAKPAAAKKSAPAPIKHTKPAVPKKQAKNAKPEKPAVKAKKPTAPKLSAAKPAKTSKRK